MSETLLFSFFYCLLSFPVTRRLSTCISSMGIQMQLKLMLKNLELMPIQQKLLINFNLKVKNNLYYLLIPFPIFNHP